MPIFTAAAAVGSSVTGISSLSQLFTTTTTTTTSAAATGSDASFSHHHSFSAFLNNNNPCSSKFPRLCHHKSLVKKTSSFCTTAHVSISSNDAAAAAETEESEKAINGVVRKFPDDVRQARRSADWKAARAYKESQLIYEGRIEGFNGGGLLVQFYSLVGFLPFPELSSSHSCKEPHKSIQETAKGLVGSLISMKVIQAEEEKRRLIFSEKEAVWTMFSKQIKVGDIFHGRVGAIEDYGAFVHLRFPDGSYPLTGLVHVSEVSWDLVQDVRDILNEGDELRVKVIKVDREKLRITLSIKQLEEDPLLETLDKVIPQDGSVGFDSANTNNGYDIEPLPGLKTIFEELLQEDGISDVRISRQGFEKKVVSQDLQLWLSNAPALDEQFTLLARAGRQVQEIQLTTSLDQEGIKRALQRVLERVP